MFKQFLNDLIWEDTFSIFLPCYLSLSLMYWVKFNSFLLVLFRCLTCSCISSFSKLQMSATCPSTSIQTDKHLGTRNWSAYRCQTVSVTGGHSFATMPRCILRRSAAHQGAAEQRPRQFLPWPYRAPAGTALDWLNPASRCGPGSGFGWQEVKWRWARSEAVILEIRQILCR